MRWSVELRGTDDPVIVETDGLCESYDKALYIFYVRRAQKLGHNAVVTITGGGRRIAGTHPSPLIAFTRAIARGLDENIWTGDEGARSEAVAALERVQQKLVFLGSSESCQQT